MKPTKDKLKWAGQIVPGKRILLPCALGRAGNFRPVDLCTLFFDENHLEVIRFTFDEGRPLTVSRYTEMLVESDQ